MNKAVKRYLADNRAFLLLVALILIAVIAVPRFAIVENVSNIMQQISVNGIVAVGMTLVIITGGFDLSVGSVMALAGVITMKLMDNGVAVAILAGALVGFVVGLLNGTLIEVAGINPFIATLGMMGVARGLVMGMTDARPVSVWNESFAQLSLGALGPIPFPLIFMVLYTIILELFIKKTRAGHNIFVYGSNREAGFLGGINMKITLIIAYALCGLSASIAGLFLASRLGTGSPIIANDAALVAIASVVLGGTSLAGGKGDVVRTLVGVLILGILMNAMNLLEIQSYYQTVIKGILVVAVVLQDSPVLQKIFSTNKRKRLQAERAQ